MKILFLAQQLPYPLDSGGKIKSYHFLRALGDKHEIILLSFIRREKEKEYLEDLAHFCKKIEVSLIKRSFLRNIFFCLKTFLTGRSFIIERDFTSDMKKKINKLIAEEKPDVIHVDHLQMAQFVQDSGLRIQDSGIKIVLDEHNVEHLIIQRIEESSSSFLKRIFSKIESRNLRKFEKKACLEADLVITVTDKDRNVISELTEGKVRIETVPIGVDTEYFNPVVSSQNLEFREKTTNNEPRDTNHEKQKTIVFIGTMFWPPNVDAIEWFVDKIWTRIKSTPEHQSTRAPVKLQIIGRKPTRAIKRLAEQDKNIELIEYAEDIRPYMQNGKVFIVPLRQGSGMRVKILNAFACGIPVVSTSIGAEGIAGLCPVIRGSWFVARGSNNKTLTTKHDFNIWIEDKPREFAKAVVELVRNRELAKQIAINARKLVEERYSWPKVQERLLEIYDRQGKQGRIRDS